MTEPAARFTTRTSFDRRSFLSISAAGASALVTRAANADNRRLYFDLSLVETSLSRSLKAGQLKHQDFVRVAREKFDIEAVEYASQFFPDGSPPTDEHLKTLNKQAARYGVRQLLIAIAGDVRIADAVPSKRERALRDARRWIDAARSLGCHSVRINPTSTGNPADQSGRASDSVSTLCEYAEVKKINVLLGNYGGLSADASWIAGIVNAVDTPCCRTLPRIRNLMKDSDLDDLARLVPLAKGLTVDTTTYTPGGDEAASNLARVLMTVHEAGYRGYVGVNYRGRKLDEFSGIRASIRRLEQIRDTRESTAGDFGWQR